MAPQKFREIVFLLLYSADFGSDEEGAALVMSTLSVTKKAVRLAQEMCDQVVVKKEELDALIVKHAHAYELDRIPKVERTVLRLSLFEMLEDKIPPKVILAEAIRLTRKFATKEASSFVNAVLDNFYHEWIAHDRTEALV